jgi:rhamnulokinase
MSSLTSFAAVDLGASSGRVILGKISNEKIEYEEVHRFGNGPFERGDGLYWDIDLLKQNVMEGLTKLANSNVVSIGVDSWAVDYGLVDDQGELTRAPHHYRDERNLRGVEAVESIIDKENLYEQSGLQFLPFNTLYQLSIDHKEQKELLDQSEKALLIPDLFNFWLCGSKCAERTNASTTGLLDPVSKTWNKGLITKLGIEQSLLGEIVKEGTYLGTISPEIQELTGLNSQTQVVTVGSHDTASAFVAVPSTKPNSLFLSSGTWSLLGVELDNPVLSEAARKANFTNEGGVDGRIRFLKNVTGLWLLQECVREWKANGQNHSIENLIEEAKSIPKGAVIDVNDPRFIAPGNMSTRIVDACKESGQAVPSTEAEFVRVVIDSLVAKYIEVIQELENITQTKLERIHVVGGGSQNELLNQLLANESGLEVFAGPVEATALGNLLVQARAAGVIQGSLENLRELVAKNFAIKSYSPTAKGEK